MKAELGDTVEARTIFMAIIQGTVIGVSDDRYGVIVYVLTNRGNVHPCRPGHVMRKLDNR